MNLKILAALRFFSLVDREGNLSISNVAVIVIVTRIAIAPFDWATAAALLVSLLNYSHKRYETNKYEANIEPVSAEPSSLQLEVDQLKSSFESVNKLAEDTKKLLSQSNLASAFIPRNK